MGRRRGRRTPHFEPTDPLLDGKVVATLDLHGLRPEEVEAALVNHLQTWRRTHPGGIVHIITGRGRRSAGGPVLKPRVRRLLETRLSVFIDDVAEDDAGGGFKVRLR